MKNVFISTIVIFLFMTSIDGQDFNRHKWNNRILLVLSSDVNLTIFKNQLKEIETDNMGFQERKLIIYKILPESENFNSPLKDYWIYDSNIYEFYNEGNENFKVILIGLDGRTKLEQSDLLTREKLFQIIDSMPMRKAELKRKQ